MADSQPFPTEKIEKLISWAHDNPYCDFYNKHWGQGNGDDTTLTDTQDIFNNLPYVTREELAKRPHPSDRLFVDRKDVTLLRSTSGTSGRAPFLFWNNNFSDPILYNTFANLGVRRGVFFCSVENFTRYALEAQCSNFSLVYGDPHNLSHALQLAKKAQVNALMASPTLAGVFSSYLAEAHYIDAIDVVFLYGEQCTATVYEKLRRDFRNAQFIFQYAQSEVSGSIGLSYNTCNEPHSTFHIQDDSVYVEIDDNGEIVLTTLTVPRAHPLIRYRSGDAGEFVEGTCPCGNPTPRLRVKGRIQGDFVRAGGGEFKAEELERVLAPFSDRIEPVFQLELSEKVNDGKIQIISTLKVIPRTNQSIAHDLLVVELINTLIKQFHLSPTLSFEQAISAKLIQSPTVQILNLTDLDHKNPRIIFRHA